MFRIITTGVSGATLGGIREDKITTFERTDPGITLEMGITTLTNSDEETTDPITLACTFDSDFDVVSQSIVISSLANLWGGSFSLI